jgi:pimeloyl-ACP methyl ester carboxylesterase
MKRKLGIAALVLALLAAGFYFRPMTAIFLYRDIVLWNRGVEGRTAEIGDHRLHSLSQGTGRPIVILPGLLSEAADASPLLNGFAARHRAIALDLLGQGDSSRPDISYTIADQSAAVIGFLEQADLGPVDLLGVSMGGWIALDVAAKRPDLVRTLILAGSGGLRFRTNLTPETFAPQDVDQLNRLIAMQSARAMSPMPDFVARDMLRRLKANEWVTLRAARSMISWREAYDGRLATVRVPTLVYWGSEDRIIPVAVGERLAAGITGARLVVTEGCGHLAVLECREAFIAAVEAFLAQDRPAR